MLRLLRWNYNNGFFEAIICSMKNNSVIEIRYIISFHRYPFTYNRLLLLQKQNNNDDFFIIIR